MSHIANHKSLVKRLSLPLEVHFFPNHGSYDMESMSRYGIPLWRGGIQNRHWESDPQGEWEAREEISPWEVRERFLDEGDDAAQWDDFTYEFGMFGRSGDLVNRRADKRRNDLSGEIGLEEDFRQWRELLRTAMLMPRNKWHTLEKRFPKYKVRRLFYTPQFTLRLQDGRPIAVLRARSALDAILASLHLDELDGIKFQTCVRCGELFEVDNRHVHKFCRYECAHYFAVKASRARAALKKKRKKKGR
jgi:hypothetical protein